MAGEANLKVLLTTLRAELVDGVYVFVTLSQGRIPPDINPRMSFQENEGITLIMLKTEAKTHGLAYEYPSRMITLNIHSSLEAIGFMATITTQLAYENIAVNPVSGFYHDHLFVPEGREHDALHVLENIADKT